jgi:1,4-alpha-glucan branching enzyme
LISNAIFWLDLYHVDGPRVDAVTTMLELDFGRKPGEWIPNRYGGRENLQAIDFLRQFNQAVYNHYPDVQTIAEEATAWPMVWRPTYIGGLGFGMKWDLGWMHDTLEYLAHDPLYRKYAHHKPTFRMQFAFNENFVLPLSHDEVVYGKRSLQRKEQGVSIMANNQLSLLPFYAGWGAYNQRLVGVLEHDIHHGSEISTTLGVHGLPVADEQTGMR